jgi:membrane-bound lytic murein transglycosylase MltF
MKTEWRSLIEECLAKEWPDLENGSLWIEAQMMVESHGNPTKVSGAGAKGLMQLMPATAREMGVMDSFDPEDNMLAGIKYLHLQYLHLPEVPDVLERMKWSLAAYNGGRFYVNRAFKLARLDGEKLWWKWNTGRFWLMHRDCQTPGAGKYPYYNQIWQYVEKVSGAVERAVEFDKD